MTTVNPDDLFAVNRDDITYSVEHQNLMASLENTDYIAVNRDDITYKITGQEFIESVVDPLSLAPHVTPEKPLTGQILSVDPNVLGGKSPFAFSFQWKYKTSEFGAVLDYPGETGTTYLTSDRDEGYYIACEVTVTDALGTTVTELSNFTEPVAVPSIVVKPSIIAPSDGAGELVTAESDEIILRTVPDSGTSNSTLQLNTWNNEEEFVKLYSNSTNSSTGRYHGQQKGVNNIGFLRWNIGSGHGGDIKIRTHENQGYPWYRLSTDQVKVKIVDAPNRIPWNSINDEISFNDPNITWIDIGSDDAGKAAQIWELHLDGVQVTDNKDIAQPTTLTLAGDKDLTVFQALDDVQQDSGHTPTSSLITTVAAPTGAEYSAGLTVSGSGWDTQPAAGFSQTIDAAISLSNNAIITWTIDPSWGLTGTLTMNPGPFAYQYSINGAAFSADMTNNIFTNFGDITSINTLAIKRWVDSEPDSLTKWSAGAENTNAAIIRLNGLPIFDSPQETVLTLTDDTDLANFRVGDETTQYIEEDFQLASTITYTASASLDAVFSNSGPGFVRPNGDGTNEYTVVFTTPIPLIAGKTLDVKCLQGNPATTNRFHAVISGVEVNLPITAFGSWGDACTVHAEILSLPIPVNGNLEKIWVSGDDSPNTASGICSFSTDGVFIHNGNTLKGASPIKITEIDENAPSITVDGGNWSTTAFDTTNAAIINEWIINTEYTSTANAKDLTYDVDTSGGIELAQDTTLVTKGGLIEATCDKTFNTYYSNDGTNWIIIDIGASGGTVVNYTGHPYYAMNPQQFQDSFLECKSLITSSYNQVIGPATTPATGTVASTDPAANTMTLSVSDETYPKRWIVNQGKFVKGEEKASPDEPVDISGMIDITPNTDEIVGFAEVETDSGFAAVAYPGNGSSTTITTGFPPDMVWTKQRNGTRDHVIVDTVRGPDSIIYPSQNYSQAATGAGCKFNPDGITFGNDNHQNQDGFNYIAWCWSAGDTTVANYEGTIASQVRSNGAFSTVKYTGTGVSLDVQTIGHGLSSPPKFVIVKNLQRAQDWYVGHDSATWTTGAYLNVSDGFSPAVNNRWWNSTAPDSSVITLGEYALGAGGTNLQEDHIAYCWADSPTQSFGTYTGTGTADGPEIDCGFEPAFVMIKCTSVSSHWLIVDNARDLSNPVRHRLFPNLGNVEENPTSDTMNFTSTGFKIIRDDGDPLTENSAGQTYVYAAFGEKDDRTTLEFAGAKDLELFESGDAVVQNSGHTPASSLIASVDEVGTVTYRYIVAQAEDCTTLKWEDGEGENTVDIGQTPATGSNSFQTMWKLDIPSTATYYNTASTVIQASLYKSDDGINWVFDSQGPTSSTDGGWGSTGVALYWMAIRDADRSSSTPNKGQQVMGRPGYYVIADDSLSLTLTDDTDLANFRVGDAVQVGVNITNIIEAPPTITVDGGTWSGSNGSGDPTGETVVRGPVTTPATGVFASTDGVNTMTLSASDETYPKRWIVNQGKYVVGPDKTTEGFLHLYSSEFASEPAGALGHTTSDWQITLKTDTTYSTPVDQTSFNSNDLTSWPPTNLEGGEAYRCRVRHRSQEIQSEWSDDVTFMTADEDELVLVGKPADWVRAEDGTPFGNKKLINAFGGGYTQCWGGVATDGTVAFARTGSDITTWITDPTGNGFVAAGLGYGEPYFILRADGKLLYRAGTGIPTDLTGFIELDDDVILAGNFGAVAKSIGYVKSDGRIYVVAGQNQSTFASCGYTNLTAGIPQEIPVVLPAGEEVKRFLACAGGGSYTVYGWVVLTKSGQIYQFGYKDKNTESGGTASNPINVTPSGEKIVSLGMTSGAYEGHHGCFAISKSGKLYGYMSADSAPSGALQKHGPLGEGAWAQPFSLIDDSATYLEIATNYLSGAGLGHIMRHTVENGFEYARENAAAWTTVPGSVPTTAKLFGAYSYNSGVNLENSTNYLLMPKGE